MTKTDNNSVSSYNLKSDILQILITLRQLSNGTYKQWPAHKAASGLEHGWTETPFGDSTKSQGQQTSLEAHQEKSKTTQKNGFIKQKTLSLQHFISEFSDTSTQQMISELIV